MPRNPTLCDFRSTPAPYRMEQGRLLAWLRDAHVEAEARINRLDPEARAAFADQLTRVIARVACGADKIGHRGVSVPDTFDRGWADHVIYDLIADPRGATSRRRSEIYGQQVDAYFAGAYAADDAPPDDLIHVTCTGYVSPSGAQKLVAARGWPTRVTHAYHMGCYAAIPAVRIADGLLAATSGGARRRVDVAHTELCSLHMDPTDHRVATLVVHSLFADGLIRYSVASEPRGPGLELLAVHELLVPDTDGAMTWVVGDHGMQMTLSVDVPLRIAGVLRGFVGELLARAGCGVERLRDAVVAVHPGGPKIIDRVRDGLELGEPQVATSRAVLRDHGNMSSATLPHIWHRIVDDPAVPAGTLVPSLAFGPGLTVCGAVFVKR